MMNVVKFTDQELVSYLSGTLAAERAAALEAQIETDPELEARLLSFDRAQAAPLRDAFADIAPADRIDQLAADLPGMHNVTPATAPRRFGVWGISGLAAAASFAVAALLFTDQGTPDALRWQEQVAIYQALYVTETLTPIRATAEALSTQLRTSETQLGRDLPLEVVGDLDGVPLLRAQVLGLEGAPLIQMAYLTEAGVPVAFCITERMGDLSSDQGVVNEPLSGLQSVQWSDGTFSYMIVGDLAPDRLARMAEQMRQTL